MKRKWWLLAVFATVWSLVWAGQPRGDDEDRFIVLSEFQVWADPVDPDYAFKALSRLYNTNEKQKTNSGFLLKEDSRGGANYTWDLERTKYWVDEAIRLGCFNLYCLGDDLFPAEGHLFNESGINPSWRDFFFRSVEWIHAKGLMAAVEPKGLPKLASKEEYKKWARTFVDPEIGRTKVIDVIKLSLEWFGAYQRSPAIAEQVDNFIKAIEEVNPDVLVYIDSVGGKYWQNPNPFHYWLVSSFPNTIISHYLNVEAVPVFRSHGFRNMMSQVNPSEGSHFFIYHDRTVSELKKVVQHRVRYISLAGVNWRYDRYDYGLFLKIIRPHLNLVSDLAELRATLQVSAPDRRTTKEQVRDWEEAFHRQHPNILSK